ncbi:MAG TPA: 3-deoxy-manno-octulosonate cytidylyltransferase [Spirochaetia bacterium]|nr:3-deoxy-manno-octulosonate cytidylyltransferase [Spirochaetales bacterium]HRY79590.1 3-deoxy-manno-octulosonate cytidylyltransferase [Spirochaetia bacterium]HRZ87854.1 3-deoxy-manno-octulosonate cytidylyltransferase [Spirochaetia bacterium]
MNGIVGVIPARYASTRLPGKPLADILGKPMIRRVYESAARARVLDRLLVATDDERIAMVVRAFGGEAVLTSPDHPSGSDRIAEAIRDVRADIVVNIQGDEPFVSPTMIEEAVRPLLEDPTLPMSTLMHEIPEESFGDPNVVKVVVNLRGEALYFSRSLIPFPRKRDGHRAYEHVGIYAYRAEFLRTFTQLPPSPLERFESLEQLRVLENGYRLKVVETRAPDYVPLSIDTVEDLERARKLAEKLG